jgi:CheY-like chemotaxis protein
MIQPLSKAGFMALVLCTGVDKSLLKTRKLILEAAGHTVVTVTDELSLLAACEKHSFDVAVVGQSTGQKMKRRIAALVREHCPDVKVLELYEPHMGQVVDDADSWLATPVDVPKDFADRVDELATGKGKSDTA